MTKLLNVYFHSVRGRAKLPTFYEEEIYLIQLKGLVLREDAVS